MRVVTGVNGAPVRRPICATEVFVIADSLRRGRSTEFALDQSVALAEVRLLYALRDHGAFIERQGGAENALKKIATTVDAVKDLCSVAAHVSAGDAASVVSKVCVLSEDEIIQLVDLRVVAEVDLYKVVPDIDLRLGGEQKVKSLLALLSQLS